MFGTGTGSELRHPLGISIVGGLLVSQVLTLFHHTRDLSGVRPDRRAFRGRSARDAGDAALRTARREHLGAVHSAGRWQPSC